MKTKLPLFLAALGLASALIFTGCATNGTVSGLPSAEAKIIAKAGVTFAVLKVTENHPEKAAQILAISQSISQIAGSDGFNTVDLLIDAIRIRANVASLSPADQVLANLLIDTVGDQLKQRIGTGTLTTDKLLIVGEVAGWINDAAKLAAVPGATVSAK